MSDEEISSRDGHCSTGQGNDMESAGFNKDELERVDSHSYGRYNLKANEPIQTTH